MKAPIDLSKFRKMVAKSIPGLSTGFNDPKTWLSTGCYALNYLICGDFKGGVPLEGKFTMFAGDSGSGKSYITSANIVKDCQRKGVFPILIDTENALDEKWLIDLGVDINFMEKVSGATIDDVSQLISELIKQYKAENDGLPYADKPRMCIIIDSLGMLITPNQVRQFEEGDQKGDMGIKAKQMTAMLRVTMAKIASEPIGLLATNHVMDSQDQYQPDKIPGGKMLEFASSVIVQMNKYLLKEDEDGNKLVNGAVAGIRSTAVVRKSRYAKPFEKIKIEIPYDKGMNPYSGLFDLFVAKGVVQKDGARWTYTSPTTGEILKDWRKNFRPNGWLDTIIEDWAHWENGPVKTDLGEPEGEAPDEAAIAVGDEDE
jgi:RecA/RadA recombinase